MFYPEGQLHMEQGNICSSSLTRIMDSASLTPIQLQEAEKD